MTGGPPAHPAAKRPWWVPLLGVGSMGLGGMQFVGGIALFVVAMQLKGAAAGTFFLLGAAWAVPGAVLAISGIGITVGAPWGRWLSVAAVALGLGAVALVGVRRKETPVAVADFVEEASAKAGPNKTLSEVIARLRSNPQGDPVDQLRNPELSNLNGWVFTAYCGCPALPWQALLLLVCLTPAGTRIARP